MTSIALRSIVLVSTVALALTGSTRPRYGGALRVQVASLPAPEQSPLVAETLVRVDARGEYQPMLARTWTRDTRRWRFTIRPKVTMHDGTQLTASLVAGILGNGATMVGQQIVVPADANGSDVLERLASMKSAIVRRAPDGGIVGTGPFRVTKLEAGRVVVSAFESHWAGRPFLDTVEFSTQRGGGADVVELPVSVGRRAVPERMRLWTSRPRELLALVVPENLREAFALAVDRQAIANVITQGRGEPARGLLPAWLTGYATALPAGRDVARARTLVAGLKPAPVVLDSPPGDPLLRLIADRIALNARDAGLDVRVGPGGTARLMRVRVPSNSAAQSLGVVARGLGLGEAVPSSFATLQSIYDAESSMVTEFGVVPIVHIPEVYAVDPRVRNWDPGRLETVWVAP